MSSRKDMPKKKTANKKTTYRKTKKTNVKVIIISSLVAIIAVTLLVGVLANGTGKSTVSKNSGSEIIQNNSPEGVGVEIIKSDITKKATFYPFQAGDTYMEVIAIRASDGTIRTALNTCQVCTGSGRAYYQQDGDVLVCQNCGNRFTVDQIEVVKGGCNPVPIFNDDTIENNDIITISSSYLTANKELFYNWKN